MNIPHLVPEPRDDSMPSRGGGSPTRGEGPPTQHVIGTHVVLVVDDDAQIRRTLAALVRAHGFEAITAADGQEGLEIFRDVNPDLVLCDVMMPTMDGFEFCRRLKRDPESRLTPVVLITGLGNLEDRVSGIEAGADDFLSKPFEEVELVARVRSLIRVKEYTDELERAETVLFTLARAIEARDAYTEGHCERLSLYGSVLAARMGLPEAEIEAVRKAGIVHDIGKIAVPDHILHKAGPLTTEERAVIEEHPATGERICGDLRSFRLLLPIIRHHHEKFDGTGYPDGLRGAAIPMTARVLQIVDVFDALTTDRPYRSALPVQAALEILNDETTRGWWDPDILEVFREVVADGIVEGDVLPH